MEDGLEEPKRIRRGAGGFRPELGQEPRQLDPPGGRYRHRVHNKRRIASEGFDPRTEWKQLCRLESTPEEHEATTLGCRFNLVDEPRLTHAGLAEHGDHGTSIARCITKRSSKDFKLT